MASIELSGQVVGFDEKIICRGIELVTFSDTERVDRHPAMTITQWGCSELSDQ